MSHTQMDMIWLLVCGLLVLMMQSGFLCLEVGAVRQKNTINVAMKNMVNFMVATIAFFSVGFSVMFGTSQTGWFGTDGWLLGKYFFVDQEGWVYGVLFFHGALCGVAISVISGGVGERMRFGGCLCVSLVTATLVYPVFGHWVWGGDAGLTQGWLAAMGYKDFAGSSVIHMVGGATTLACLTILGPRMGRYNLDGTVNKIWGSNLPLSVFGGGLIWIGWFGMTGGVNLSLTNRIGIILINTNLAACGGALSSLALTWAEKTKKKLDLGAILNGLLGGLVAISASCPFVSPVSALIIGVIAGVVVNRVGALLSRFRVDDAIGVVPVHLGCGMWGVLSVALFAKEVFLTDGGRVRQILVQMLGMTVCFIYTFAIVWLIMKLMDRYFYPLRVSPESEESGLNVSEHGVHTFWHKLADDINGIHQTHDLSKRVYVEPETEAGAVARVFNKLMDSLQEKTREASDRTTQLNAANLLLAQTNRELLSKNDENEMFFYGVSHDLRSPLLNLVGFSKELSYVSQDIRGIFTESNLPAAEKTRGLALVDEMTGMVRFIQTAVGRVSNIIDGLLRLSREGRVEYRSEPLDLNGMIGRILASMQMTISERGAKVALNDLPFALGDPTAIEQVFANLIGNAMAYVDPKRPVFIEVGHLQAAAGAEAGENGFHTYYVKDNGVGIPEKARPKLFHLFQRFHPEIAKGNGIGLAIVRRIVNRHGGDIWVESTEGAGSTFFVRLPAQPLS